MLFRGLSRAGKIPGCTRNSGNPLAARCRTSPFPGLKHCGRGGGGSSGLCPPGSEEPSCVQLLSARGRPANNGSSGNAAYKCPAKPAEAGLQHPRPQGTAPSRTGEKPTAPSSPGTARAAWLSPPGGSAQPQREGKGGRCARKLPETPAAAASPSSLAPVLLRRVELAAFFFFI